MGVRYPGRAVGGRFLEDPTCQASSQPSPRPRSPIPRPPWRREGTATVPEGRRTAPKGRRTALVVVAGGMVLAAAAGGVYVAARGDGEPWTARADNVVVAPPTDGKAAPVSGPAVEVPEDPEDVATDTATPTAAALQITFAGADDAAGAVVVGAYVAGLIEDGGTCSLTLSGNGSPVTVDNESVADAALTSCGQLLVPYGDLAPGTWTADVTYSSPAGHSVADARTTIEVP